MASLEQRIAALEKVVDAVTHRLTWEDLALFCLTTSETGTGPDDCTRVMVRGPGGNRQVYPIEQQWVDDLMAEHGYRLDWDGWWRRVDQAVPEKPAPPPPYVPPPEPEPVDEPEVVHVDQAPVEPVKRVPPKRMKWWEWMAWRDGKDIEREDDDDPRDPRL